jgi:hypothetical protein
MKRFLALSILCFLLSSGLADEKPLLKPKIPLGTWEITHEDGSVNTLTLGDKGARLVSVMPIRGTTTLTSPQCQVSEEGVVFGYFNKATWVKGTESISSTTINPFAFIAHTDNDSLVITDLRVFDLDAEGHKAFTGTWRKVVERNAGKKPASAAEAQR